jgi:2-keto-4-pentenoate hydratase/2-oxohepta-3-ene-1,7-dioic acid hydratase in catechol pathway
MAENTPPSGISRRDITENVSRCCPSDSNHCEREPRFRFTKSSMGISARDVQKRHTQFMKGKCLDRTCPLGPYLVHKHDLNPRLVGEGLKIKCWVNNQLRQDSSTSQMIFTIEQIVHQLSQGMTLYPGDIILTGTPAGVGYAMTPPQALKERDRVRIEIEELGTLENEIGP